MTTPKGEKRAARTPWLDRTRPVENATMLGLFALLLSHQVWLPGPVQGFALAIAYTVLILRPAWLWIERRIDGRARRPKTVTVVLAADASEFVRQMRRIQDALKSPGAKS
jgi:hypothetical protein